MIKKSVVLPLLSFLALCFFLAACSEKHEDKSYGLRKIPTTNLAPIPINTNPDVNLAITIKGNQYTYQLGDQMSFQVIADKDGYITLWDIGTSGKITRIFPNQFSDENFYVKAGSDTSIGGESTQFVFEVTGKTGSNDVYAIWSEKIEDQPKEGTFNDILTFSKNMIRVMPKTQKSWASKKITFDIIDKQQQVEEKEKILPTSKRPYIFNHSGKVYVVAMGANTSDLQQANRDAEKFIAQLAQHFTAKQYNPILLPNVTKKQFIENLEDLSSYITPDDMVFIYFSGHGVLVKDDNNDEKGGNDAAFVTTNIGQGGLTNDTIIRDDLFAGLINRLNTKKIISVIDACHSGGLSKSLGNYRVKSYTGVYQDKDLFPIALSIPNPDPLPILNEVKGLVLAAAEENYMAIEVSQGGVFTLAFVNVLLQAEKGDDLFSIFDKTQYAVKENTKKHQKPTAVGNKKIAKKLILTKGQE